MQRVDLPCIQMEGDGVFFSDTHCGRDRGDDDRFLASLAALPSSTRWVVLGGDTFDFMVGRNLRAMRQVESILDGIVRFVVSRRRRLIWIEGNHDFHLDRALPAALQSEIY